MIKSARSRRIQQDNVSLHLKDHSYDAANNESLPPRSEAHRNKKVKKKNRPFSLINLLFVLFIFIVLLGLSSFIWYE